MKKIIVGFKVLLLTGALISCDVLDVEPEQSISTELVFDSIENARGAVVGMYAGVRASNGWGGFTMMGSEYVTDNTNFQGSFTNWQEVSDFQVPTNSGIPGAIWQQNYININRANNVLASIEGVPGITQAQTDQFRAEALFVRAISHFQMVRYFGQPYGFSNDNSQPGIPYLEAPGLGASDDNFVSRVSVGEVYSRIVRDLEEAEGLAPAAIGSPDETRGRGSLGSIRGMLMMVHLHRSDWSAVENYARLIKGDSRYALAGTVNVFGTASSPEDVFTVVMTADTNPGVNGSMPSLHSPAPIGRGDIRPNTDLLDAFETDADGEIIDERHNSLLYEDGGNLWTSKYRSPNGDDNVRVVRMGYVVLSLAEALQEQSSGVNAEALELTNSIRERAGLPALTTDDVTSGSEMLDAIRQERRLELAFEGHRKWDILRWGMDLRNITSNSDVTLPYGDNNMILPIPQRDRDVNENLTQNPGYGE